MHPAGNRLEIVDGKSIGINVTVPADEVERVAEVVIWVNAVLLFNVKQELALFIVRLQILGLSNVPLAERRMLQQLAEIVPVPFRRHDGTMAFHDEQPVVFIVELELVSRSSWQDKVIPVGKLDASIHRAQSAAAFMDENHLVGVGIFEKIICHALPGCCEHDFAVVVDSFIRVAVVRLRSRGLDLMCPII